jgi:ketosteroid isomerase-like protein
VPLFITRCFAMSKVLSTVGADFAARTMSRWLLAAILVLPPGAFAQAPPQASAEILRTIDAELWTPFARAYGRGDAEALLALHSRDLVRPLGDAKRVLGLAEYAAQTRQGMQQGAQRGITSRIGLRFTERMASPQAASERGVYEVVLTGPDGKSRTVYGRFHVISRKEDGRWKILVDYDSSEGGTVDEASYRAAHAANDYGRF